jgi:hypothetical protein
MDLSMDLDTEIYNQPSSHTHSYNGLNDYGNYVAYGNSNNLYNPMINRGFQNSNGDDAIYTLHNYLLSLTLNTSSINTNNQSGLTKKELDINSTIIECHDSSDCPICLCNYPQYTYFYLMKCNHSFCIDCCEKWFGKNSLCPLCRRNYK